VPNYITHLAVRYTPTSTEETS